MALFNYATRELSAKIVYYGPGLSGKTTNIEMVHQILRPEQKGRLISLPTETDRTLFFDFLPIDLGLIKGFKVRFHLYTVPGQVFYNATRRLVLQGVDGVVFVADSQREMMNSNLESLRNLVDNLSTYGKKLEELPFVLQYNKRDLRNIATVGELDRGLNFLRVPTFEAVAPAGKGVTETLVAISRLVFANLRKTLLMPGEMAAHEDIGELADARIQKSFTLQEAEPLEEISEVEEIREPSPPPPAGAPAEAGRADEVEMEPTTLRKPEASRPAPARFEELAEIEVEVQEPPSAPPPVAAAPPSPAPEPPPAGEAPPAAGPAPKPFVAVEAEGGALTFLKFEAPFVSPEGHAVLPALFLDGAGNPVRLRIRISMEEDRH
jgi:signal recognition particle receptor subunit beta